jgi:hypothetical protein
MKRAIFTLAAMMVVLAIAPSAQAELILYETTSITLDDGTTIHLILSDSKQVMRRPSSTQLQLKPVKFNYLKDPETYKRMRLRLKEPKDHASGSYFWPGSKNLPQKNYYYLPPPPKVSTRKDGSPEFTFIKFVTDKSVDEGGVAGGLLHFLAEYGLTAEQEKELARKLSDKIKGANLMGAVPMGAAPGETTFEVISGTLSADDFTKNVVASGRAPLLAGQKVAVAARLTPYGATLLEESLKKPTSDISITFNLTYTAHAPAFTGKIKYNWSKVRNQSEYYEREYHKKTKRKWFKTRTVSVSDQEMQMIFDFCCEKEILQIEISEGIADERVEAIRQLFMETLTNWFFTREQGSIVDDEDDGEDLEAGESMDPESNNYRGVRYISRNDSEFVDRTQTITWRLPVKIEYSTTGNISGGWFKENKDRYPEMFSEINLDDPFFQQRRVVFNLDLDAVDIFEDAINHVSVEVRKDRKKGRDFTSSALIDKKFIDENGISADITYAKMREDDPGAFEYLVRWSLRGGVDYPENPKWHKGSWEGITLAPPVRPLLIEAEADLYELEELDIVRATVQLRYSKFGKVYEDAKGLQMSVAKGEAIQEKTIYHDPDNLDLQYQITFYHKKKGRIRLPWQRGSQDGYIFCTVPEDVRQQLIESEASDEE